MANVEAPRGLKGRALRIAFDVSAGRAARISTPIVPIPPENAGGSYRIEATPRLYPGVTVTALAKAEKVEGNAAARLFVHCGVADGKPGCTLRLSEAQQLRPRRPVKLEFKLPADLPWPIWDLGIRIETENLGQGELFIDRVSLTGAAQLRWPDALPLVGETVAGWVSSMDSVFPFATGSGLTATALRQNWGRGLLTVGTTDWADYTFSAQMSIKVADMAGLIIRYQGLERYIALVKAGDKLRLLRRWYGDDEVLAECACPFAADESWHTLSLVAHGSRITARCDGRQVLHGSDDRLGRGGAGLLCQVGRINVRQMSVR